MSAQADAMDRMYRLTRHVYDAIVEDIAPQSDGTCQVTAKEYLESFYQYDDATYPGDVA